MNELLKKISSDLIGLWNKLNITQKILSVILVLFLVIGFILMMNWIRQPHYVVLYSNINPEDAGLIVDKLKELKINYRLAHNGTSVEVPAKAVYEARIQLAKEGLPQKSEVGYELFDQNKLGMSDFMQKFSYRRALEGELVRTIQQMHEIDLARVHIVIPERSLFEEDKQQPTASVVLKLKPNVSLNKKQIRGIAHLISSSVEGLKPDQVTIIDYYGNILSEHNDDTTVAGLSTSQLEFKKMVDGYLASKIKSLFDNVLGSSNFMVQVDADLDFKKIEKTTESYDPENTSVRSEEIIQEASASDTNQPRQLEHTTTNYEINKTVEHVLHSAGNIKRLSIALLVNDIYKREKNEKGEWVTSYTPRSQEDMDRLAEIAKNAVGFDETRNDRITVTNFVFDTSRIEKEQEELQRYEKKQFIMSIVQKAILGIVVLVFLLYFRFVVKKALVKLPQSVTPSALKLEESLHTIEPLKPLAEEMSVETQKVKLQQERIRSFAEQQPQEVSRLIRTWLEEDRKRK